MTSLTAPWDLDKTQAQTVSKGTQLTEDEVKSALSSNLITDITDKSPKQFPRVDKMYADPIYNNQTYCLHSFVPSKGATPDEKGVFGFMKCRGSFHSIREANERAEFIIRNVDSYHDIQTGYSGRPFPVCADTKKFVKETHEVDIRKEAVKTISEDILQKKREEKQQIEEIKEREENMLRDSDLAQKDEYKEEPMEKYITLNVKKANLVYTYMETRKKLLDMQDKIRGAYKEIGDMDKSYPSLSKDYFNRYKEARKSAHIPDDKMSESWMKFLCEDADLDFEYK
jgi:hypothetical protein